MRQTHLFWIHSSCVTVLSVSLWMRSKGLITINYLCPSFCQFVLYVLFIARRKENKTKNSHRLHFPPPLIIQSPLPPTLLQRQWCTVGICLWSLCSSLIFKTSFSKGRFCLFVLLFPDVLLITTENPDYACRMYYTWKHQHTKSVPFSLCPPLSILSSNSYFPSLSPFHHFFGINTHYIPCLKGYG